MSDFDIGDVYIKRAAGGLASLEGLHHRKDRVANPNCQVGRLTVWRIVPVQKRSSERPFQKTV